MIVVCPGCGRRYKLSPAQLEAGRRLRCQGCGRVFGPDEHATAAPASEGPLAVVGDEMREFRDLVQSVLTSLGCRVQVTDDGEMAFRFAVSHRPALMILNVYMRRMLGVAVCEGVKGSPDLRATRVALVGSVFKSERFVRRPIHLYGADDYFEDVIPEAELRRRLQALLGGVAPAGEVLEPHAEIRRLARIMLSDLKIYYPDEFRRALAERRFLEIFREELTQAKDLIARRFPDMPDRLQILAAALKEGLLAERPESPVVRSPGPA